LTVAAVASRTARSKTLPAGLEGVIVTEDWREVVSNPDVDVVAELVGGTGVAREIVETAIANGKAVVTANKELMGLDGVTLGRMAAEKGVPLAMEASVCGGIPIHAMLKEGICGDRIRGFFGILNGTSNYILTEIEQHGTAFDVVLKEAQRLGYASPIQPPTSAASMRGRSWFCSHYWLWIESRSGHRPYRRHREDHANRLSLRETGRLHNTSDRRRRDDRKRVVSLCATVADSVEHDPGRCAGGLQRCMGQG